jgi:hypothetical protein
MPRVLLIHQNAGEASERAKTLRAGAYDVTVIVPQGLKFLRDVRRAIPDAIVIDIERLPSVGRDIGIALRMAKSTRNLPMVFAGGVPEKIAGIRMSLPDASYAPWPKVGTVLKRAMTARRNTDPVVPRSIFEPYSETPLLKKTQHQAELVDRTARRARRILQIAWPIARRCEAARPAQPRLQPDDMVRSLEQGAESTNQENRSELERRIDLGRLAKENLRASHRPVASIGARRRPLQRTG